MKHVNNFCRGFMTAMTLFLIIAWHISPDLPCIRGIALYSLGWWLLGLQIDLIKFAYERGRRSALKWPATGE